ncbi:MAG: prephenate dehydrogenase/arogenate dehydrogenase family protein [Dehalococcoidia bacterium]
MAAKRVSIIGLGLIGGSLGLALKQAKGPELEIIGFARRSEVAAEAIRRGAVDAIEPRLAGAVSNADVVIVATPLMAMRDIFRKISRHLSPHAIVSDVGSTKGQVIEWARIHLPGNINFVGGHPMTGKETSGIDQAQADLFRDCIYCLTPAPNASSEASKVMEYLVESVGARPLFIEAAQHDEMVAGISHLPLLLSSALVSTLARDDRWAEMSTLAASGFRDVSRLASGSPEVHRGICATNQQAIVGWIDRYIENLKDYRRLVLENDQELEKVLRAARKVRDKWLESEGRRFNK